MLKEDGNFCAKFFKSSDLSYLYVMMKQVFKNVYVVKPQSSRASSAEAFVVGLGFLGEEASKGMSALSASIKTMKSTVEEVKEEDEEEDVLTF
jgi:tRNA (cytidine32/guanosine34-2'-O)-methyltransferase